MSKVLYIEFDGAGYITLLGGTDSELIPATGLELPPELQLTSIALLHKSHYVLDNVVTARSAMSISVDKISALADANDAATFTGVPEGAIVSTKYGTSTITGGTLTVTNNVVENVIINFSLFPYIDFSSTVTFI